MFFFEDVLLEWEYESINNTCFQQQQVAQLLQPSMSHPYLPLVTGSQVIENS